MPDGTVASNKIGDFQNFKRTCAFLKSAGVNSRDVRALCQQTQKQETQTKFCDWRKFERKPIRALLN